MSSEFLLGRPFCTSHDPHCQCGDNHVNNVAELRSRPVAMTNIQAAMNDLLFGELQDYSVLQTPDATPPFYHDVLTVILLFVSGDLGTQMSLSRVCRTWRFFSNYLPVWEEFTFQVHPCTALFKVSIRQPMQDRATLLDRALDAEIAERRRMELKAEKDRLEAESHAAWVKENRMHARYRNGMLSTNALYALAYYAVFWLSLVGMSELCWLIGHGHQPPSTLDNDAKVGLFSGFVMCLLCVVMLVMSLGMHRIQDRWWDYGPTRPDKALGHRAVRSATLTIGICTLSLTLGPAIALLGIRVKVAEEMQHTPPFQPPPIHCGGNRTTWQPELYVELPAPLQAWRFTNTSESAAMSSVQAVDPSTSILALKGVADFYFLHLYVEVTRDRTDQCGQPPGGKDRFDIAVTANSFEDLRTFSMAFNSSRHKARLTNALVFRSYVATLQYFGLPGPGNTQWMTEDNPLWTQRHTYLINIDYPELAEDQAARIDTYTSGRGLVQFWGMWYGILVCLLCACPCKNDNFKLCGMAIATIIFILIFNPVMLFVFGSVCLHSGGTPEMVGSTPWALCDTSGGIALLCVGASFGSVLVFGLFCGLYRCFK